MWFNNLMVYQYTLDEEIDFTLALAEESLKPCPPHARFIYGWLPAFGDELVQEVAGAKLICMGKEERLLPRGVIQRVLAERIQQIQIQQGRQVKRNEKAQMMEDIEFELLPKSFCVQKKLHAILDTSEQRIMINSSSENQASQLLALLRKSIPGLHFEPLNIADTLSYTFANWITTPSSIPENFALAKDCLLFSPEDEKKRFNCKGYEMPAEEVLSLLSQGLAPSEISLNWNEHIQFSLTQEGVIKRIKCLDYLIDEFNELRQLEEDYLQQDAALTLLTGELRGLLNALLKAVAKKEEKSPPPITADAVREQAIS
ncbi:MAG: recombination-associated protein RdgC [Legionellaceae bacterium]|nr:recombination-associated protein RdgC [Legionellaceae bacterium]